MVVVAPVAVVVVPVAVMAAAEEATAEDMEEAVQQAWGMV
jgi:uncharacterized protein YqgC (DUF456 family)